MFLNFFRCGSFSAYEDMIKFLQNKNWKNLPINITIFYPLLILNRDIYECNAKKNSICLFRKKHYQLHKTAIFHKESENFRVDIIDESYINPFIKKIENEQYELIKRILDNAILIKNALIDFEKKEESKKLYPRFSMI